MKVLELLTESRGREIDYNKFESLVRGDFSNAWNAAIKSQTEEDDKIFRGATGLGRFTHYNTSLKKVKFRSNKNTDPWINQLLDKDPRWGKLPNRGRSLICTTDTEKAWSYGEPHVVLPKNGTTVAFAGADDFWETFSAPNLFPQLDGPGSFDNDFSGIGSFSELLKSFQHMTPQFFVEGGADHDDEAKLIAVGHVAFNGRVTLQQLENADSKFIPAVNQMIKKYNAPLDEYVEWLNSDQLLITRRGLQAILKNGFIKTFASVMSPKTIKTTVVGDNFSTSGFHGECWMEGEVILVDHEIFKRLWEEHQQAA
jgi:hypothetical protein